MEIKEIETTVEIITDKAKIEELTIRDKQSLLQKITGRSGFAIFLNQLPVKNIPKSITSNGNVPKEKSLKCILGIVDTKTRKFLGVEDVESLTQYRTKYSVVFKEDKNNITIIPLDTISLNDLIENVDIDRIQEFYSMYFMDLLNTKYVFGLYKKKMEYSGQWHATNKYDIQLAKIYTLGSEIAYALSIELPGIKSKHNEGNTVKLSINDLEFVSCKTNKGYNLPKDRNIVVGNQIILLHNKSKCKGEIIGKNKPKISFQDKSGKKVSSDIWIVKLTATGETIKTRKKNILKIIG